MEISFDFDARKAALAMAYLVSRMAGQKTDKVKLMKLLWDSVATEFGGRHELYEINYGGSTEEIRRYALFGAQASGNADRFKGFAEQCMAEYDLDGWTVPDLVNPGDASVPIIRSGISTPPLERTPAAHAVANREENPRVHGSQHPNHDFDELAFIPFRSVRVFDDHFRLLGLGQNLQP